MRQTLALEARIAEGIATARVEEDKRRADEAGLEFDLREQEVRDYVVEAIEAEAAERQAPDSHIERLLDDLDERMNEGEYDEALADGPIGELVARICADLGVTPDWSLWDDQGLGRRIPQRPPPRRRRRPAVGPASIRPAAPGPRTRQPRTPANLLSRGTRERGTARRRASGGEGEDRAPSLRPSLSTLGSSPGVRRGRPTVPPFPHAGKESSVVGRPTGHVQPLRGQ